MCPRRLLARTPGASVNKRRREILSALQPAALIAMQRAYKAARIPADAEFPRRDVPGLAMRARPSAEAPAEILIYGRIGGGGWFMDGISAADVAALLREAGPGPVNVRINSGGGDVFDGVAIHSLLARHAGTVVTYVDGLAASAASFIMLAGSRVVAARNSFVMIHDAMTYTYGNGDTHRSAGDLLDKVSDNIADMYAEKAGEDPPYWRNIMTEHGEDGTWYTGQEAMDAGLVDEITGTEDDDDDTDALLSGWVDLLPATISANLKLPPEPTDQETTARWDPSKLTEILKGVLA